MFFNIPAGLDQERFDKFSLQISHGDILGGKGIYSQSPLYPYFLALIYSLFGHSSVMARIFQMIMGAGTCVLLYLIGSRIFNRTVGVISGIICSLYGVLIFYEGELLRVTVTVFLTVLLVFSIVCLSKSKKAVIWLIPGIVLGLLILCRPNNIILVLFILIWLVYVTLKNKKLLIKRFMCFFFGVLFALTPLFIRNHIVGVNLFSMSSQGVTAFVCGHDARSPGSGFYYIKDDTYSGKNQIQTCFNVLKTAFKTPSIWFRQQIKKSIAFWNGYEIPNNSNFYLSRKFSSLLSLPLPGFVFIASMGIIGIIISIRNWQRYLLVYLIIIGCFCSVMAFYILSRFRQPIVPFLILFTGFFIDWLWKKARDKDFKKLVFFLLCAAFLSFAMWPRPQQFILPQDHYNMGLSYVMGEKYSNAIMQFDNAIKLRANYIKPIYMKGFCLLRQRKPRLAIREFEEVLKLDPYYAKALKSTAIAYGTYVRDKSKAVYYLDRYLKLCPDDIEMLKLRSKVMQEVLCKFILSISPKDYKLSVTS
ncbi:MAG: glycosyltransferase family 39 protein [bacterium]|nr:glycosyltransferase family 39 protein [bacterium]